MFMAVLSGPVSVALSAPWSISSSATSTLPLAAVWKSAGMPCAPAALAYSGSASR